MTRPIDEALDQQRVVAERADGLSLGRGYRGGEHVGRGDETHAFAAATSRRLDQHGEPDRVCLLGELGVGQSHARHTGDHANTAGGDRLLGPDLVAHRFDRRWRRTDEGDAGGGTCRRQRSVLGQESVARMQGLRAGRDGCRDDSLDVEVALRRCRWAQPPSHVGGAHVKRIGIGVAVDSDRSNAHGAQRPHDAYGDLSAVGYENGVEHQSAPSHPEHAVADRIERCLPDDRQRESQDRACLQWFDDAVVPQACREK